MGPPDAAEHLLSGPRGRRLCWSLLSPGDYPGWERVWHGARSGDLTGLTDDVAAAVALTDLDAVAGTADERALLAPLADSVVRAMYWQEPDGEDRALARPVVQEALLPVARAVTRAPAARWWPTPVATDDQQQVEWLSPPGGFPPVLTGTADELAAWRAAELEDERSAQERPEDPSAPMSGHWWSAPALSRLPSTTRSVPGLAAVGLALVEDELGWQEARCSPMRPSSGARVYEISGPDQWTRLAGRYPLDVSRSRRHDWWRVTGWSGTWLVPDFTAIASDYDAVHLTVTGYLTTAGRALPVGSARTMLAGWDPDQTYWLADVLTQNGPATRWIRRDDPDDGVLGWVPAEE